MGTKKKAKDLFGHVIEKGKEGAEKAKSPPKKTNGQTDLFPETIPTTSEGQIAAKKLSAAERKKFKKAQTDMFPDELKDATEVRKLKAVKNRKNAMKTKKKKAVKKAAGGPIKFAKGGKSEIGKKILGRIWKKGKKGAAAAKKKSGELIEKSAEKTGDIPKNIRSKLTTAKDIAAGKKVAQARHAKLATSGKMTPSQRKKVLKRQAQSGYASGGPVRKSIDGIAQRGLTRAKHK